jgi:xanthine/CO dehydrogenase XdhC/CoxF family maturation factor
VAGCWHQSRHCDRHQDLGLCAKPGWEHLVIDADGRFLGSVSHGCIETDVVGAALNVIDTGAPRLLEFGVDDETACRVGLPCGGQIKVYVERID